MQVKSLQRIRCYKETKLTQLRCLIEIERCFLLITITKAVIHHWIAFFIGPLLANAYRTNLYENTGCITSLLKNHATPSGHRAHIWKLEYIIEHITIHR